MIRLGPFLAVALLLAAWACNGQNAPRNEGLPAGVISAVPELGRPAVETLYDYLRETGLDGKRGAFTDPINCPEAVRVDAEGEFCIFVDAGHYARAASIIFVSRPGANESWQVHVDLNPETSAWEVTDVQHFSED